MATAEHTSPSGPAGAGIDAGDHATRSPTPRQVARNVILQHLGIERVADWCGVKVNSVYVWLKRGTDHEPIPVSRALTIHAAACGAGLAFDVRLLAPSIPASV